MIFQMIRSKETKETSNFYTRVGIKTTRMTIKFSRDSTLNPLRSTLTSEFIAGGGFSPRIGISIIFGFQSERFSKILRFDELRF